MAPAAFLAGFHHSGCGYEVGGVSNTGPFRARLAPIGWCDLRPPHGVSDEVVGLGVLLGVAPVLSSDLTKSR